MRQFEFQGSTYTLTEEQYHKLLNRFDEGFAIPTPTLDNVEYYVIRKPCICEEFADCADCPLRGGSEAEAVGCLLVLAAAMQVDVSIACVVFRLDLDCLWWQPHQDVCARRLLRKVYKALRRLPFCVAEECAAR